MSDDWVPSPLLCWARPHFDGLDDQLADCTNPAVTGVGLCRHCYIDIFGHEPKVTGEYDFTEFTPTTDAA